MQHFTSCKQVAVAYPDSLQDTGVLYLLRAKTFFKVGATKRPGFRIPEQAVIGSYYAYPGETPTTILVTNPTPQFRELENTLKLHAFKGLRFKAFGVMSNARPRECYHMELWELFVTALAAADSSNLDLFNSTLPEIEAASNNLKPIEAWIPFTQTTTAA